MIVVSKRDASSEGAHESLKAFETRRWNGPTEALRVQRRQRRQEAYSQRTTKPDISSALSLPLYLEAVAF